MSYFSIIITATLSLLILTSELNAKGFYKWTDAKGNVRYSDEPPVNGKAKKMKLPAITILKDYGKQWETVVAPTAPVQPTSPKLVVPKVIKPKIIHYKALNFIAPKAGQRIKAKDGDVSAMLNIKPHLKKGHSLLYILDGKKASRSISRIANFQNLSAGAHKLIVKVVDHKGTTLQSSYPIGFKVIR